MLRFSLIIKNQKDEYLICQCPDFNGKTGKYEFLGGEIDVDILPNFESLKPKMKKIVNEKICVNIDNFQLCELYLQEEAPLSIHAIFTARITSGSPIKKFYTKLLWLPKDKIDIGSLNMYGKQVYQKICECSYCYAIHNMKVKLDKFFDDFFEKQQESLDILETLENVDESSPAYRLAFRQELSHLRAFLIENKKQKNNITVQNYFRLYKRNDLAKKIDKLLNTEVKHNLTLKDMIRICVDKYIAHYDKPTNESREIYNYCFNIFSTNGKLPLKEFIKLLDKYIMALITEMWYDAGELGIPMSDRCSEHRDAIINFGKGSETQIIQALTATTSVKD
jgi:hypothetical protein